MVSLKSSTERQHFHYGVGDWSGYATPRTLFALLKRLNESQWAYDAGLLVYADAELDGYVILDVSSVSTCRSSFMHAKR